MLPPLRDELAVHAGARTPAGAPTWTLQDPVRSQFFRLDWLTFEILAHWHLGNVADIVKAIRDNTPLDAAEEDVIAVGEFLTSNQLLRPTARDSAAKLAGLRAARRPSWWKWLIHNYLFFRIALVRPDRLLDALADRTTWLFTRAFLGLTVGAGLVGSWLVYRQWDSFHTTLLDTFSLSGLLSYAVTVACVKVFHELGHGIVAKRAGCHVPAMGIAFLVLWPMPYTDTNEAWKLADRKRRLAIASAGILTELAIAAWATLAWALLADGPLKSAAFLLATTTWISTLAINCGPFMRFDGYFILCDLTDMPNLHGRAFALARWKLRRWLFGLKDEPPEFLSVAKTRALVAFAIFTWTYRLVIFLGIAVLVYTFFIKLVGILLFAIEIIWFIFMPIMSEVKVWWSRRKEIARASGTRRTLIAVICAGAFLVFPLPWRIHATGALHAGGNYPIVATEGARVDAIQFKDGDRVAAGAVLFRLASHRLDEQLHAARARVTRLESQAAGAAVSSDLRSRLLVLQSDLEAARANVKSIETQLAERSPTAPYEGIVRLADPDLRPNVTVARHEKLAVVISEQGWRVETYVTEAEVQRLAEDTRGRFYVEGAPEVSLGLRLVSVDTDATRVLPGHHAILSHLAGGSVIAREQDGAFHPEKAVYKVTFEVTDRPAALSGTVWRGRIVLFGEPESLATRGAKAALSILWREAGL